MILQATSPIIAGGINPSWVLTGVVSIMVFLLWRMLATMQKEIKENSVRIGVVENIQGEHQVKIIHHDEEFKKISESNSRLADEIVMKLRLAQK